MHNTIGAHDAGPAILGISITRRGAPHPSRPKIKIKGHEIGGYVLLNQPVSR